MAIKVLIDSGSGAVDYSKFVEDGSLQFTDTLNQPTVASFNLVNITEPFTVPARSSYVQILSTDRNVYLATGYMTQEPERRYLGIDRNRAMLTYSCYVTSDEWLLNLKTLPFNPAFVNQTMGQIIQRITEALVPNVFNYTNVNSGDTIPYYKYDPTKMWSEVIKDFADSIRYRYKVLNKAIYFKPYGDDSVGLSYDDTLTTRTPRLFDPYSLETNLLQTPIINDAIIVGDTEPGSICEDCFIGDGFTSDFPLKHKVFHGTSALLLQEDWSGTSFAADLWTRLDPQTKFVLAGTLNVLPGTPGALGSSYILGNNGIEIGGHLNLYHGEVTFPIPASPGSGIIGGVYTTSTLSLANCSLGFYVTGGTIRPVVNGVLQAAIATVQSGHHYQLQTLVDSKNWSRYNRLYRSLAGNSYGASNISSTTNATFLCNDIPTATPAEAVTTRYETSGLSLNSFGLYAPVNTIDLNITLSTTQISHPPQGQLSVVSFQAATGTDLPVLPQNLSTEQTYPIGFGLGNEIATIQATGDSQQLRFYSDSIPGAGARIRLRTWEARKATARVRSIASVTGEGKTTGDDGVRTAMVTDMNPLPRTSEECELAAQAFIADRTQTQYNGRYTFPSSYLSTSLTTDFPRPGRFLSITSPMRNISTRNFILRRVTCNVEVRDIEQTNWTVEFGPDLAIARLLPSFLDTGENILQSTDAADRPDLQTLSQLGTTFLSDLTKATFSDINGTTVTVNTGITPVTGVEVRRIDGGWGVNDANRIGVFTTQSFTLDRSMYEETFYMRQINGAKTSRYTTRLRVVYPLVPDAPTGELDTRDQLRPKAILALTGDIRNIAGIEVRSCMVSGAIVTGATVTGNLATNIETPIELITGYGYKGEDKSVNGTVPLGSQNINTNTLFTRSEFLFNPTLYEPGTQFYFEAVVTNSAYSDRPAREIYIEKQMRGRTNPNPVIVHTLAVPPGSFYKRIRFMTPFTGYQYDTLPAITTGPSVTGQTDYTDAYRIRMQAESQPVIAGYNQSTTIFPSADFVLHGLRLIATSIAARKTCIDIPMIGVEGHSFNDLTAEVASESASGATAFSKAGWWMYNASEWSDIIGGEIHATMSSSSVTGSAIASLYDMNSGSVVASAILDLSTSVGEARCARGTFTKYQLTDGHEYEIRLSVGLPATTMKLYQAWIRLNINPIVKLNVYWRYGAGAGNAPVLRTDEENGESPYASGFAILAGAMANRFFYDPAKNSNIESIFLEATMGQGGGNVAMVRGEQKDGSVTGDNLPGWFGYTSGNWVPAQNWTTSPNYAKYVNDLAAILLPERIVDDYHQLSVGVIMSAWQFALFAAQMGGAGPAAGVTTLNNLRNSIFSGALDQIAALHATESGWKANTEITFSSGDDEDWSRIDSLWGSTLIGFNSILSIADGITRVYFSPRTATDGNNRFRSYLKSSPATIPVTHTMPSSRPGMTSIIPMDDDDTVFLGTTSTGNNALMWKFTHSGGFTTITFPSGLGADAMFCIRHPTNSDILFWGNQSGSSNDVRLYTYVISTGTFTKIGGTGLNGSWNLSGSSISCNVKNVGFDDTNIYVMINGGASNRDDVYRATLDSYASWTRIGGAGLNGSWATGTKRNGGLAFLQGKLYAFIGGSSSGDAEVWVCSNPASSPLWTQIGGDGIGGSWASGTYLNASNAPTIPNDTKLVVGVTGSVNGDSEVWLYDTSDLTWTQIGGDGLFGGWSGTVQQVNGIHITREDLLIASPSNNTANSFSIWAKDGLFGGNKDVKRLSLTDSTLVQSSRYYTSPATNLVQAFLVFHIESISTQELEGSNPPPVPGMNEVLERRRFLAPSDLTWIWDNNPYRQREICFRIYFFNLMWEYSEVLELSANMVAPAIPVIQVISVLTIDIQIRLDVIATEDTVSVTVQMASSSLFVGEVITVKGGPLQSVYSLHLRADANTPVVGQYIRARRTDYLGNSDWSEIVFVSADDIRNQSFLSSLGLGTVVSNPLNNLFSYVSDSTFITWSWPDFTLTYPDGFIQYINAGSYTSFTSLTPSTTYKFYPYLQGVRLATATVVIIMSAVTGGTGDDPDAASETKLDQRTPLSREAMEASTTGGGGGSGSGGGVG